MRSYLPDKNLLTIRYFSASVDVLRGVLHDQACTRLQEADVSQSNEHDRLENPTIPACSHVRRTSVTFFVRQQGCAFESLQLFDVVVFNRFAACHYCWDRLSSVEGAIYAN